MKCAPGLLLVRPSGRGARYICEEISETRTNTMEMFTYPLRTETPGLHEPIPQRPTGLALLTLQSALRLSITTSLSSPPLER
jgi:hypothetical protein